MECIQYITKENLLLLKDLLGLERLKSTNAYMASVSKNVYINKLDDIVNECNDKYHRTIKMKPVDVKDNTYIDRTKVHSNWEVNDKDPKFEVGDHVIFLNTKIFLLKDTHQFGLKRCLWLKKLKIQFHGHILLMI